MVVAAAPPPARYISGGADAVAHAAMRSRLQPRLALASRCLYVPAVLGYRGSHSMRAVVELILIVINLYWWVVIASAVMSWLVAFGVINTRNRFVASLGETLYRLTEPALRPIRNVIPDLGGVDISPVILLLLLWFIERLVILYLLPLAF
jgi:YggT family protein